MEEATHLAGLCANGTLVHRGDTFRASQTMQARVLKNAKIKVMYNAAVEEVLDVSIGQVTGVRVRDLKTNEVTSLAATGFFVAIGHTPNTDIFKGQVELHDNGYVKTKVESTHTSIPGVFACRHVQDFTYHQTSTTAC